MGLPGRASVYVIPTYVGNVVQNIYYNPIQLYNHAIIIF